MQGRRQGGGAKGAAAPPLHQKKKEKRERGEEERTKKKEKRGIKRERKLNQPHFLLACANAWSGWDLHGNLLA